VPHGKLVEKLTHYNFSASALRLVKSYLENRFQSVKYRFEQSAPIPLSVGVPQGSILGPLLFVIYMNDLPASFPELYFVQYADDTSYSIRGSNLHQLQDCNGAALIRLKEWFTQNGLIMNESKTKSMTCSVKPLHLEVNATSVNFLGVKLDPQMTWSSHGEELSSKLLRQVYLLRSLASSVSQSVLRTVYFGCFHSLLTYGVLAWGHTAAADTVFRVQRRAVRILYGLGYREDCRQAFISLKILTLPSEYVRQCLLYAKVHLEDFPQRQDIHQYLTRNRSLHISRFCRIKRCQDGMSYWGVRFFNMLPQETQTLPLKLFKRRITEQLERTALYSFQEFSGMDTFNVP